MRIAICLMIFALAASCARPATAPAPAAQAAASGCVHQASHPVRFSDAATDDVITATSAGPTCRQAVVIMTIRNSAGDPLWTFAETYNAMTNPGGGQAASVTDAQIQSFLDTWTKITRSHTLSLPDWAEGKATLAESAMDGASYSTPFERDTYRALRERNLPQLCFSNSPESAQCLIIDPASNAPTVIAFMGA